MIGWRSASGQTHQKLPKLTDSGEVRQKSLILSAHTARRASEACLSETVMIRKTSDYYICFCGSAILRTEEHRENRRIPNLAGFTPRTAQGLMRLPCPLVTFEHFHDFGTMGPDFCSRAETLAERMYARNVRRAMIGLTDREWT